MATVNLPLSISFSLQDETGSRSTMQVNLATLTTLADARTAANALLPLLSAVTDCTILGYTITASSIETPSLGEPVADGRVERRGVISYRTGGGKVATVSIPGIKPGLVTPEGRLDEDVAAMSAFMSALQAAPFTDSNNQTLGNISSAYEAFRSTGKRQLPAKRTFDAGTVAG